MRLRTLSHFPSIVMVTEWFLLEHRDEGVQVYIWWNLVGALVRAGRSSTGDGEEAGWQHWQPTRRPNRVAAQVVGCSDPPSGQIQLWYGWGCQKQVISSWQWAPSHYGMAVKVQEPKQRSQNSLCFSISVRKNPKWRLDQLSWTS